MNILLGRIDAHSISVAQHTAILFRGTVYDCYHNIRTVRLFLMLGEISGSTYILFGFLIPDR